MDVHKIDPAYSFHGWEQLPGMGTVHGPKIEADFVVIAVQDRGHTEAAVAAARCGYNILLEKPMATSADDCLAIVQACEVRDRCIA